jgi:hypothetical protein
MAMENPPSIGDVPSYRPSLMYVYYIEGLFRLAALKYRRISRFWGKAMYPDLPVEIGIPNPKQS